MNPNRSARSARVDSKVQETEVVRLLSQRFGDGLIYLAEDSDQEILLHAMEAGLISSDGHLTAAGYRALKRGARD